MMSSGGPGVNSAQFMAQQGYPDANKGYMQQGVYGRGGGGYQSGPGYGGRSVCVFVTIVLRRKC